MRQISLRGNNNRDKILMFFSLVAAGAVMLLFAVVLVVPIFCGSQEPPVDLTPQETQPHVSETNPPVITGAKNITVYRGESVAYRKNVTVSDDSGDDNVTLEIDSSRVDISKVGTYAAVYTASDKSGNKSSVTIFVTVIEPKISLDELNNRLDTVLSVIIRDGMNTEAKIRAVYDYVQGHISYVSDSDKSDWRAEAYNALFVCGTGDCFSFFAASKAFFERLGIESLDIQRTPGLIDQTHYWSMVNISDDSAQKIWYHYDSCRLRAEYNHSGCLLTEQQIEAYNKVREHFYAYDKTTYPQTDVKIITPTPEIEQYYE